MQSLSGQKLHTLWEQDRLGAGEGRKSIKYDLSFREYQREEQFLPVIYKCTWHSEHWIEQGLNVSEI